MGDADEGDGLLNGHVPAVDIVRPYITDALLSLKIILGDMLHGDGGILKMFDLPLGALPVLKAGIKNHKGQHGKHDEYIDKDDPVFFHSVFRPSAILCPGESAYVSIVDPIAGSGASIWAPPLEHGISPTIPYYKRIAIILQCRIEIFSLRYGKSALRGAKTAHPAALNALSRRQGGYFYLC
jgi:hypothetical protein